MKTRTDKPQKLKTLGNTKTAYVYDKPSPLLLEVFLNQFPERAYVTEFIFTEFTSLCPKTGQPDFAEITVQYIPKEYCIETKSLKLYLLSYRQHGSFMETIVNNILEHLVSICHPRSMTVTGKFNARGGTFINVKAEHNAGN